MVKHESSICVYAARVMWRLYSQSRLLFTVNTHCGLHYDLLLVEQIDGKLSQIRICWFCSAEDFSNRPSSLTRVTAFLHRKLICDQNKSTKTTALLIKPDLVPTNSILRRWMMSSSAFFPSTRTFHSLCSDKTTQTSLPVDVFTKTWGFPLTKDRGRRLHRERQMHQ